MATRYAANKALQPAARSSLRNGRPACAWASSMLDKLVTSA